MKGFNERLTKLTCVFDAQASNTVSANLKTKTYDHIVFQVGTAASTDGTLKIRASVDKNTDLTAAQAVDNIWDYKYIYNLNSASGSAGSTGIAGSAGLFAEYKVNVDCAYIMALELTGWSAGAWTVNVFGMNKYGS